MNEDFYGIKIVLDILKELKNSFISERKVNETLSLIYNRFNPENGSNNDYPFKILHNIEESILNQLIPILKTQKFDELLLLAPFLSSKPEIIEKLIKQLEIKKVKLLLPKDNYMFMFGNNSEYLELSKKTYFEIKLAKYKSNPQRKFHSKLLYFKGQKNYLLIGSANLTISALDRTAENGNIECSILYEEITSNSILDQIEIEDIKDLKSIQSDFEEHLKIKDKILRIYAVDFDEINRKLTVETEKINRNASIKISLEKSQNIITKSLKDGKFYIDNLSEIPNEIEITCGDKSGLRRIYYDKNNIMKKLGRSGNVSVKEIYAKFSSDLNINFNEFLTVLAGLGRIHETEKNFNRELVESGKSKKTNDAPSRSSISINVSGPLERLKKWYEYIKLREIRKIESFSVNGGEISKETKNVLDDKKEREKLMIKITKEINNILLFRISLNPEDLIASQCLFTQFFLKFFATNMTENVLKEYKNIITENLENKTEKYTSKSQIEMFSNIIIVSYIYKDLDTYSFLRDVFDYYVLLNEKNYHEIQKWVMKLHEHYFPDKLFNNDRFMKYYLNLVHYSFGPDDIEEGLNFISENYRQEKTIFKNVLREILSMIAYGVKDVSPPRFGDYIINMAKKSLE